MMSPYFWLFYCSFPHITTFYNSTSLFFLHFLPLPFLKDGDVIYGRPTYSQKKKQGSILLQKIDNSAQMHIQKDIILPITFSNFLARFLRIVWYEELHKQLAKQLAQSWIFILVEIAIWSLKNFQKKLSLDII